MGQCCYPFQSLCLPSFPTALCTTPDKTTGKCNPRDRHFIVADLKRICLCPVITHSSINVDRHVAGESDKLCLREWASKLARCQVLVTLQLFLFLSFFSIEILNFSGTELWIKVWNGQVLAWHSSSLTSFGLSESLVKNKHKEKGRAYILGLGLRCPLHCVILKSCRLWLLLPPPSIPDIHHWSCWCPFTALASSVAPHPLCFFTVWDIVLLF